MLVRGPGVVHWTSVREEGAGPLVFDHTDQLLHDHLNLAFKTKYAKFGLDACHLLSNGPSHWPLSLYCQFTSLRPFFLPLQLLDATLSHLFPLFSCWQYLWLHLYLYPHLHLHLYLQIPWHLAQIRTK